MQTHLEGFHSKPMGLYRGLPEHPSPGDHLGKIFQFPCSEMLRHYYSWDKKGPLVLPQVGSRTLARCWFSRHAACTSMKVKETVPRFQKVADSRQYETLEWAVQETVRKNPTIEWKPQDIRDTRNVKVCQGKLQVLNRAWSVEITYYSR